MRYKFNNKERGIFFRELKRKSGLTSANLAIQENISRRTFYDWEKGNLTTPYRLIERAQSIYGVHSPMRSKKLPENWAKSSSGRIGGLAYVRLYGQPSTIDGCIKGGRNAVITHKKNKTGMFTKLSICHPKHSRELSEFIGIILGDGGITKKQIVITLHEIDDLTYSQYVTGIIKSLFGVIASTYHRKNTVEVTVSRIALVVFLVKNGLSKGNKVRNQVGVPKWIKDNKEYSLACARGLFDTDGCFYIDKHIINNKLYKNTGINFTNRSLPLLSFFKTTLEENGLHPTHPSQFAIYLRRESDIIKFFDIVGSSNDKHLKKFEKYYIQKYGRVPKRL